MRVWLACGIIFTASVWCFAGDVVDVPVIAAYWIVGAIALIMIIYAILVRAERDEARMKRDLYYHQLCRKHGYSGIIEKRVK